MTKNNIPSIPHIKDRGFVRVDGEVYFHSEPIEFDQGNKHDRCGLFIPTFVQEEDDLVGLSIDAFREKIIQDNPPDKERLLEIQQLLSMIKRFVDAELAGNTQTSFKKTKINISGSGIAFPSEVAYQPGHLIRLDVFFPKHPFSYVSVAGSVVRCEKADIGYDVKVRFMDISKKTQDEILKFVNQCSSFQP